MIDYKKELNAAQLEAVEAMEGPVVVLAGAGSGKTRTLIYRICHLIETGSDPSSILLLTFTNKAAKEMQERAEQMLGEAAKKVTACTYHSFCTRMLRKYAFQANLMRDFTVLSASDPATIIDMMIAELGYSEIPNFPTAKQIAGFISDSINRGIPLRMAIQKNRKVVERGGFYGEIENVRKRADAYKRENDLLDYDDLMLRFLELLKDRPDVAEKIDEEFRYISIDEYQDTNSLQAAIIKRIREKNRNLLVVGDDYQSIYGFRGSDIRIIQSFPDDYPGAKIIFLTQNYRSSPQIVNLANEVMHKHAVEDRYKKSLISENPDGPVPFLVSIKNQAAVARVVADNIVAGHNNGRAYKDSLVLVRNSSSFTPVETELVRRGIPYEKRGGPKFFDLKHVKDTLVFIRIFCNPRDELSWFRIVHLIPGVGDVTARNLSAKIRENGEDALISSEYQEKAFADDLKALFTFMEEMNCAVSVNDLVRKVIRFYREIEGKKAQSTEEQLELQKMMSDLEVIAELSIEYKVPTELLDSLAFDMASGEDENGEDDKVVLSTIHSAKGLEYDSTYILDCIDGMFPSTTTESIGSEEDQEELRCFYVAVTRAKRLLYMFCPTFYEKNGWKRKGFPSHFFHDVKGVAPIKIGVNS